MNSLNLNQEEDITQMRQQFEALDTDKDGQLSIAEVENVVRKELQPEEVDRFLAILRDRVDANGSGAIDYSEFISLCCNRTHLLTRDNLTRAFKELDLDGNGQLDKGELRKAFEAGCGLKRSDSFWEGLVNCID
jgi:calcium-dependent protein kinase